MAYGAPAVNQAIERVTLPRTIKCNVCETLKNLDCFSAAQKFKVKQRIYRDGNTTPDSFNQDLVTCTFCAPHVATEFKCSFCDVTKSREHFTKTQIRQGDNIRCELCVNEQKSTGREESDSDSKSNSDSEDDDEYSGPVQSNNSHWDDADDTVSSVNGGVSLFQSEAMSPRPATLSMSQLRATGNSNSPIAGSSRTQPSAASIVSAPRSAYQPKARREAEARSSTSTVTSTMRPSVVPSSSAPAYVRPSRQNGSQANGLVSSLDNLRVEDSDSSDDD